MKRLVLGTLLAFGIILGGAAQAGAAALVPVAASGSWGSSPIYATSPPGDPRLFVVERAGAIRIVSDGVLQPGAFLTVPNVLTNGERGLTSMAFAPDYATSGLFYVFAVTGPSAQLQIIEYRVSADPSVANPGSARQVLAIPDNDQFHNGGQVVFGPDGLLYITVGDDKVGANSQDLTNLLGKVLRINPRETGGQPYSIPGGNPYAAGPLGARGEIWQLGLRNPFRASFGPGGELIVPDVGEGTYEEINVGAPAANFGWPTCEGTCNNPSFADPFHTYAHSGSPGGCAIIGGYYVSDPALVGLNGRYLFGDFCDKTLRSVSLGTPGGDFKATELTLNSASLYSFGTDSKGCVYVMGDSTVYRVAANAGEGAACPLTLPASSPVGAVKPEIIGTTLRASSKGWVKVRVYCAATANCSGRVTIRSAKRIRIHGKLKTVTFGSRIYKNLSHGTGRFVKVFLRSGARKLLKRRGMVRVKVTATSKSSASPATATASKSLRLYAPKH